jgi:hypothetical protein
MRITSVLVCAVCLIGLPSCEKVDGYVGFQPVGLPVKVKLDSSGKVSISAESSVITPIGRFFAGVNDALDLASHEEREWVVVVHRPSGAMDIWRVLGKSKISIVVEGQRIRATTDTEHQRVDIEVDVDPQTNSSSSSCRLSPVFGSLRKQVDVVQGECTDGDVCGYFLQLKSARCSEGGDIIAEQVRDLVRESGLEASTSVIVYHDRQHDALGAGAVFKDFDARGDFAQAHKVTHRMFWSYSAWRPSSSP